MADTLSQELQGLAIKLVPSLMAPIMSRVYESGSWVPALEGSTTAGALAYNLTQTSGTFIRIGAKVTATARIVLAGITTPAAGDLRIVGLPYPVAANGLRWGSVTAYDNYNITAGSVGVHAYPVAATSHALLIETVDNGARVLATAGNLTNTTVLEVVVEYEAIPRLSLRDTILSLGPISYLVLDETTGTTAADETGNGRTGTYSGATIGGSFPPFVAPTFDANTTQHVDWYSASLGTAFDPDFGSFVAAVRHGSSTDTQSIWYAGSSGLLEGMNAQIFAGQFSFGRQRISSRFATGGSVPVNAWSLVGATWDVPNNIIRAYVNGVQVATIGSLNGNWTGSPLSSAFVLSGLDTTGTTSRCSGQIAHAALFDTVLSAGQMSDIAAAFQGEL